MQTPLFDPPIHQKSGMPFLKWAGGKTQLLLTFAPLYPRNFAGYAEPFLGSGAVFFKVQHLANSGGLNTPFKRVRLADSNAELINCYLIVRDEFDELVESLARLQREYSRTQYYHIRSLIPAELPPLDRAARFIYLNRTCFNGLYRVNRKGQFNVPIGGYRHPRILNWERLKRASNALQGIRIEQGDYKAVMDWAQREDYIYLDPPYHPLSKTSSFTSYTQDRFGKDEQAELAEMFKSLDRRGCYLMLSGSWTPFMLELYSHYNCLEIQASRVINARGHKRGKIRELVVLNYDILRSRL